MARCRQAGLNLHKSVVPRLHTRIVVLTPLLSMSSLVCLPRLFRRPPQQKIRVCCPQVTKAGKVRRFAFRLWLVDRETAYRSDPLVDVAILADNFVPNPALHDALLEAWLGRAADSELIQRLNAVRALTRPYYAELLMAFVGWCQEKTRTSMVFRVGWLRSVQGQGIHWAADGFAPGDGVALNCFQGALKARVRIP
jgi:hypothetical protein